jgi:hypothetical protein
MSSKQQDRITIGVIVALALACWVLDWRLLAVFLGLFALLGGMFSSMADQREERAKGDVLDAKGKVSEAAENVLIVADKLRIGMPPELHAALDRLQNALEKEDRLR